MSLNENKQLKQDTSMDVPQPPDGGWGWFVVASAFIIVCIVDGFTNAYGRFDEKFRQDFSTSAGSTAWVESLLVGVTYCSGPMASFFVNKYGCRIVTVGGLAFCSLCLLASAFANKLWILYLTFGIGVGLSFGHIYLAAFVSVHCYFEKYRSFATGITSCGSGIGTVLFGFCLARLMKIFGSWRQTLMATSAFVFLTIIFAVAFRPLKPKEKTTLPPKYSEKMETSSIASTDSGIMNRSDVFLRSSFRKRRPTIDIDSEREQKVEESVNTESTDDLGDYTIVAKMLNYTLLLKNPSFIIFTLSNIFTSIGYNIPYTYIEEYAVKQGCDKDYATHLLLYLGISSTLGRIIAGYLSDHPKISRFFLYTISMTLAGLATGLSGFCDSYTAFCTYALVYGSTTGIFVGLTSVCLVDLVGLDLLTNAFGLFLMFQGFASFFGPPIAGDLLQRYGTHIPCFVMAGFAIAVGGLILFAIPTVQNKIVKKSQEISIALPTIA